MGLEQGSCSTSEDEYEEAEGSKRLLGFIFGNVDDAGDLDIDYLDEEAKHHLGALAHTLAPSFMHFNFSVQTCQQDYDDKAVDAVDYEDIEEEHYQGMEGTTYVFDDDNYDEEETQADENNVQVQKHDISEEMIDNQNLTPLPSLYTEDGAVILRFSEIFGIHKSLNKLKKRECRFSVPKDKYMFRDTADVEDDDEMFLRGLCQGFTWECQTHVNDDILPIKDDESTDSETSVASVVDENWRHSCLSDEPMKEDIEIDPFSEKITPLSPQLHLIEQQDWEDRIIWDSSPELNDRLAETMEISVHDSGALVVEKLDSNIEEQHIYQGLQMDTDEIDNVTFQCSYPVFVEPFGSRKSSGLISSEKEYHPQLLRLESRLETGLDNIEGSKTTEVVGQRDAIRSYDRVAQLNKDLSEGSWLDNVIWEPHQSMTKPKLILDLQDEQMLFEILDDKDGKHLKRHAGAMIITRSVKFTGELVEMNGHRELLRESFNISNDKFYSNRKSSKQLKSHSKKRTAHGTNSKAEKKNEIEHLGFLKKVKILGEGIKTLKENKSARDNFVCGACGQLGHMRNNKNCLKYGEDLETQLESRDTEKASGKFDSLDKTAVLQQKPRWKKNTPKSVASWDRQVESLAAVDGEENESEAEANIDLDSFAEDLDNLLSVEEFEEGEEHTYESKHDNADVVKGFKMRRHPSEAQAEDKFEDEAAEATKLCRMLIGDDEAERKQKEKIWMVGQQLRQAPGSNSSDSLERVNKTNAGFKQHTPAVQPQIRAKDNFHTDMKQDERLPDRKNFSTKLKAKKKNEIEHLGFFKKVKILGEGIETLKEKKSARDSFVCGACGRLGHMRTNKNCPKYGEDPETQPESKDTKKASGKLNSLDKTAVLQQKPLLGKNTPKRLAKILLAETPEEDKSTSKAETVKVLKCSSTDMLLDKATPATSQISDMPFTTDTASRPIVKVNKIIFANKTRPEDTQVEKHKPSIVIKPPLDKDSEHPRKKLIIIKRPKEHIDSDQIRQEESTDLYSRKTKKIIKFSSFEDYREQESNVHFAEAFRGKNIENNRMWAEEQKRRDAERKREEMMMRFHKQQAIKLEEVQRIDRRITGREQTAKRRSVFESVRYGAEYAPPTKRRRGGEVGLANILQNIVEILKDKIEISYLFLKPVSRKEAPDYHRIVKRPMDLCTIKEKVRNLEYKRRRDFRHDMWQITYNAHLYNDKRNPGIPPLADQLLKLCDYLLTENDASLTNAEAGIESG